MFDTFLIKGFSPPPVHSFHHLLVILFIPFSFLVSFKNAPWILFALLLCYLSESVARTTWRIFRTFNGFNSLPTPAHTYWLPVIPMIRYMLSLQWMLIVMQLWGLPTVRFRNESVFSSTLFLVSICRFPVRPFQHFWLDGDHFLRCTALLLFSVILYKFHDLTSKNRALYFALLFSLCSS